MRTDRAVTRINSDLVAMSPIVNRMTDRPCENTTFPCGRWQDPRNHARLPYCEFLGKAIGGIANNSKIEKHLFTIL